MNTNGIKIFVKERIQDIVTVITIVVTVTTIYVTLLEGNYIETYYDDWIMMAYRVSLIKSFGSTSWVHLTGNGQDIWQAFQFIPHFMAAIYSNITKLDVTTSMLHISLGMLNIMYVTFYLGLRLLRTSKLAALTATLAAMAITQTVVTIWEFSILIGLTFLPIILFFIFRRAHQGKKVITDLLPILIGLSFFIHPILGFSTAGFYFVLFIIIAERRSVKQLLLDGVIIALVSSYYWLPALFYNGTSYLDDSQTTAAFVRNLLTFPYLGLGQTFIAFTLIGLVSFVLVWKENYKFKKLYTASMLYTIVLFFWIAATFYYSNLPTMLNKFQITRWVPFIGVITSFSTALLLGSVSKKIKNPGILAFFLIVTVGFFYIENLDSGYISSLARYVPKARSGYQEPFLAFSSRHPEIKTNNPRVFSLEPTATAYYNFNEIRVEGLYFHFSPNPIHRVLSHQIRNFDNTQESHNLIWDYLDVRGVKYVQLPENLKLATYMNDLELMNAPRPFKLLGSFTQEDNITYYYYENMQVHQNYIVIPKDKEMEELNYSAYKYPYDMELIDRYVRYFKSSIYDENVDTAVQISYPSQEKIDVSNIPPQHRLIILENYDSNWKAINTTSRENINVERVGPSYISVVNTSNSPISVNLTHEKSPSYNIGLLLTTIGIGIGLAANILSASYVVFRWAFPFQKKEMEGLIEA